MIRASGTEPIVRIYAESESQEQLDALMFEYIKKVKSIISR
jgi:phosphomannomutase/phosphoglucomutase